MSMGWVAKVWASRRGRILILALLVSLVWQAWLSIEAPGKIAPDINHAVSSRGTVDLLVTLPFPPERFHILVFQRYGRVSGTSENTAEVRGVKLTERHRPCSLLLGPARGGAAGLPAPAIVRMSVVAGNVRGCIAMAG